MNQQKFIESVKRMARLQHSLQIITDCTGLLEDCIAGIREINESRKDPRKYAEKIANTFGLGGEKYDAVLGAADDQGVFYKVGAGSGRVLLAPASDIDISGAEIIGILGYDTAGIKYLSAYTNMFNQAFPGRSMVAYHYKSSPRQRTDYLVELMGDHDALIDEAKEVSAKLLLGDNEKLYVGHSYSGLFHRMVRNGKAKILIDDMGLGEDAAKARMEKTSSALFGVFPVWGQTLESTGGANKMFDKIQVGREIYILNGNDFFMPPMREYGKKALEMAAGLSKEEPFVAFHHPTQPNKIMIILAPGIIPDVVEGKINVGGHGLYHYFAALGLLEGTTCHPDLAPVREAFEAVANGRDPDITKLGATPFRKDMMVQMETTSELLVAAHTAQLLMEQHYREKLGVTNLHPVLKGLPGKR